MKVITLQERIQSGKKEGTMTVMFTVMNNSIYEQVRKHGTKGIEM